MAQQYEYKLGVSSASMTYLESLVSTMCKGEFVRWPIMHTGCDGHRYGDGLPVARWVFRLISQADLNTLRYYVTTSNVYYPSKAVAIKTRMDDGIFESFDCIMLWPEDLESKRVTGGYYRDVEIEFTHLEVVT